MTRRERISFLLEHYADVLAGVRDRGTSGEHLPLMCAAWNSPGYQELERLVSRLASEARPLYRAILAQYVHPRFVRRALCPRCGHVASPSAVGELHRHGHRKSATYVARMVRVPLYPIDQQSLNAAVAWLEERLRGEPFVPDELLPLVAVA